MYLFGRDKFYRNTVCMDITKIIHFSSSDPSLVSTEAIQTSFIFLWSYMKRCMFLPGHSDHWNTITDLGNAGMMALPRAQVLAFAEICQANMMYILNRSFYLNASWA
jgi:hypothetical protein